MANSCTGKFGCMPCFGKGSPKLAPPRPFLGARLVRVPAAVQQAPPEACCTQFAAQQPPRAPVLAAVSGQLLSRRRKKSLRCLPPVCCTAFKLH